MLELLYFNVIRLYYHTIENAQYFIFHKFVFLVL